MSFRNNSSQFQTFSTNRLSAPALSPEERMPSSSGGYTLRHSLACWSATLLF